MGAAERISRSSDHASQRRSLSSWEGEETCDYDQWCVELDGSITCLSKRQLWTALARGRVAPETPVWRDGLGHWVAIADVAELTVDDEDLRVSVPERSEIRVRRVPSPLAVSALDRPSRWRTRSVELATLPFTLIRLGAAATGTASARAVRSVGRRLTRRAVLRAAAIVTLAVAGAVAGIHGASLADDDVPRAQRVGVDVAEYARFLSARVHMRTVENERIWWSERWR